MTLKSKLRKIVGGTLLGAGTLASFFQYGTGNANSLTSTAVLGVGRQKVGCENAYDPMLNSNDYVCVPFIRKTTALNLPVWHPASKVPEDIRESLGYFTGPLAEMLVGAGLLFGPTLGRKKDEEQERSGN